MGAFAKSGIDINRKLLADLAYHHPESFAQLVKRAS
jgi:ribosomal protein L20